MKVEKDMLSNNNSVGKVGSDRISDEQADADDRRHSPRILVNLEVDYGNEDNFLFAFIKDISATGIFVGTNTPEPPGTRLNVRFRPRQNDDSFMFMSDAKTLDVEGEVIWVNTYRPGNADSLHPGMGIRFISLDKEERYRLMELVRTFAYLDDSADGTKQPS